MKGLRTLRESRRRGGIASEVCRGIAGGLPGCGKRRRGLRWGADVGWAGVEADSGKRRHGLRQVPKNLLGGFEATIAGAVAGGF